MTAYYNEIEPYAAQWLRNLIAKQMIPAGDVDERSIEDVRADDLRGYTQCHFFAGLGGWAYALRLALWPDERPVWTGSCPCQPFSAAGKQKGKADARHLWPAWFRLIRESMPPVIFGEQVASAIAKGWLDDAFDDMESQGYACGSAVLPACGVGAPHKRDRLWFVGISHRDGWDSWQSTGASSRYGDTSVSASGDAAVMADTTGEQNNAERGIDESGRQPLGRAWETFSEWQASNNRTIGHGETISYTERKGSQRQSIIKMEKPSIIAEGSKDVPYAPSAGSPEASHTGIHSGEESVRSRHVEFERQDFDRNSPNGSWWELEPGMGRVAHGVSSRVGRLRAYGNAIVPQVAAEFIKAAM